MGNLRSLLCNCIITFISLKTYWLYYFLLICNTYRINKNIMENKFAGPGSLKILRNEDDERRLEYFKDIKDNKFSIFQQSSRTVLSQIDPNIAQNNYSCQQEKEHGSDAIVSTFESMIDSISNTAELDDVSVIKEIQTENKDQLEASVSKRINVEENYYSESSVYSNVSKLPNSQHNDFLTKPAISKALNGLSTTNKMESILKSRYKLKKEDSGKYRKHFVEVEIEQRGDKLLENSYSKINFEAIGRKKVQYTGPFFHTIEFSPSCPTDEGVLLQILSHEFDIVDEYTKPSKVPWYSTMFDLKRIWKKFRNLTKEEYNAKYPWDKFYDPELYYNSTDELDDGKLNMEMIPKELQHIVTTGRKTEGYKREYSFVPRGRR